MEKEPEMQLEASQADSIADEGTVVAMEDAVAQEAMLEGKMAAKEAVTMAEV